MGPSPIILSEQFKEMFLQQKKQTNHASKRNTNYDFNKSVTLTQSSEKSDKAKGSNAPVSINTRDQLISSQDF